MICVCVRATGVRLGVVCDVCVQRARESVCVVVFFSSRSGLVGSN